jgi:predicted nuclease of predicted toxin-antitoxin system
VKVKLDENLGVSHLQLLRESGYEAERVHEEGLTGATDKELWKHVLRSGQFFVTLDLGFSDIRHFPPGRHPGILLIRARSCSQRAISDILQRVLSEYPLEEFAGCLVVADEQKTRIRGP